MNINLLSLGELLKKYRKSKDYSTQQLADILNVSAGLINNIENAKNDVFKLELMLHIIKELNIPVHEILTSLFINNSSKNTSVMLSQEFLNLISFEFIKIVSESKNKEQAINILGNWLLSQLDSVKKLKELG